MTNPTMPTADEVRAVLIAGDPDEPECRLCGENYRMPAVIDALEKDQKRRAIKALGGAVKLLHDVCLETK